MENKQIEHRCGLLIADDKKSNKCPTGKPHAPCCYYCDSKQTCIEVCYNSPEICGKHIEFKKCKEYVRLTQEQVKAMIEDYRQGMSKKDMREKYNVSQSLINKKLQEYRGGVEEDENVD